MRLTDDLHHCFLHVVVSLAGDEDGTLEAAMEGDEKHEQVLNKNHETLLSSYHHRRYIQASIAENALDGHLVAGVRQPMKHPGESSNATTIYMPGGEGKRPHAYMIVNDLYKASRYTQDESKGKEKKPTKHYPQVEEFMNKFMKEYRTNNWGPTLSLSIESPTSSSNNAEASVAGDESLDVTL